MPATPTRTLPKTPRSQTPEANMPDHKTANMPSSTEINNMIQQGPTYTGLTNVRDQYPTTSTNITMSNQTFGAPIVSSEVMPQLTNMFSYANTLCSSSQPTNTPTLVSTASVDSATSTNLLQQIIPATVNQQYLFSQQQNQDPRIRYTDAATVSPITTTKSALKKTAMNKKKSKSQLKDPGVANTYVVEKICDQRSNNDVVS